MLVHGQEPTVCTLSSHTTSLVKEDSLERRCVAHSLLHTRVDVEVLHSDCATTRVSVVVVPAVRAGVETCCLVPVVVVELCARHGEVLSSRCANTDRRYLVKGFFSVFRLANDQTADNLCPTGLLVVVSPGHLHANFQVVSGLEVVPLNRTSTLDDGAVALVLVADEVLVLGRDRRVVVRIGRVIVDRVALSCSRDVVVEDTETVAAVRVGDIVVELAKLLVLWAHVRVE